MLSGREKNVTSTSLRQAGRGLAESQGRRFRQGQTWLPYGELESFSWRWRMLGKPWGPASRPLLEWVGPKTGF